MICSSRTLCKDDNCDICFSKSFASHEKALYWNYEKNNNLNRIVIKEVWFLTIHYIN